MDARVDPVTAEMANGEAARTELDTSASGLVFVLSGPSGVGKSTIIELLKRDGFPITYCVTATTRERRPGEINGEHYYFLTDADFDELLARDELLEHEVVHGRHRYGIPRSSVREGLRHGRDLIMTPEVKGARTVRRKLPGVITIFLRPPTLGELIPRLQARGTHREDMETRLQTANDEMLAVDEYDYVVVNPQDRLPEAVNDVKSIIIAERLRVHPRRIVVR